VARVAGEFGDPPDFEPGALQQLRRAEHLVTGTVVLEGLAEAGAQALDGLALEAGVVPHLTGAEPLVKQIVGDMGQEPFLLLVRNPCPIPQDPLTGFCLRLLELSSNPVSLLHGSPPNHPRSRRRRPQGQAASLSASRQPHLSRKRFSRTRDPAIPWRRSDVDVLSSLLSTFTHSCPCIRPRQGASGRSLQNGYRRRRDAGRYDRHRSGTRDAERQLVRDS